MPLLRKKPVEVTPVGIANSKIKTSELTAALSKVKGGISTKGIVDGFGNYSLDDDMVRTYNDHICISYPFYTGIKASVKADNLDAVLKKVGEELEITQEENSIIISSGPTKAGLVKTDGVKHIPIEGIWKHLPDDFLYGLGICIFSAADNMSMGVLYCIHVDKQAMYSSDNYRISRYVMKKGIDESFLIPARSAEEMIKFQATEYILSDSWVHFRSENGTIFSCRIVSGNYKDVNSYFATEGASFTLPKEINKYVDTSLVMADGKREFEKKVEMTISPALITIRGETESGWIESKVDCKIEIEKSFKVTINPVFLNEILTKTTKITVGNGKALFQSENFDHVMVLP